MLLVASELLLQHHHEESVQHKRPWDGDDSGGAYCVGGDRYVSETQRNDQLVICTLMCRYWTVREVLLGHGEKKLTQTMHFLDQVEVI